MRHTPRLSVIIGGALAFASTACTVQPQSGLPSAPSITISGDVSDTSSARAITALVDRTLPQDQISTGHTNPCTQAETSLHLHYLQYLSQTTVNPTGGVRVAISAVIQVSTDDGFSGRATMRIEQTFHPVSGVEGDPALNRASFTLRNALGQVVTVDYVFRVVWKDGVAVLELDRQHLSCQGIPAS